MLGLIDSGIAKIHFN